MSAQHVSGKARHSTVHRLTVMLALICVVAVSSGGLAADTPQSPSRVTNKPTVEVVYMHADWCAPCKQIDREVLSDPEIKQLLQTKYRFRRVDFDSNAGTATKKRYGIQGLPVFLFLNGDGHEVSRVEGIRSRDAFRQILASGAASDPLLDDLRRQLGQ